VRRSIVSTLKEGVFVKVFQGPAMRGSSYERM